MSPETQLLVIGIVIGTCGTLLLTGVAAAIFLSWLERPSDRSHMEDWP